MKRVPIHGGEYYLTPERDLWPSAHRPSNRFTVKDITIVCDLGTHIVIWAGAGLYRYDEAIAASGMEPMGMQAAVFYIDSWGECVEVEP